MINKSYFFLLILFLLLSSAVFAKPFYKLAPEEIDKVLSDVRIKYQTFEDRARAIAYLRLGTPYVLGPLGEDDSRGPVFQTKTTDCTVFVLTTLALAGADSYKQAKLNMLGLNYYTPPRKGFPLVSYENRIHFTYDRLHSNKHFKDITTNLLPPDQLKTTQITLNHKKDGSELLPLNWSKKVKAFYIPCNKVNAGLLKKLSGKIYGVGFVREKAFSSGVVISHEGFIAEGKYLIHAGSIEKKVVKADFLEYIKENSDYFDGIIVSEFIFQ